MTLTEAAYWTKRLGIVLGGGLIFVITVILVITNITKPDPLPTFLTADYGCTATAPEFANQALQIPTLELGAGSEKIYTIETATGRLEALPQIAYVYKYSNPGPSLDSQRDAKKIATQLGMDPNKIILRGGVTYEWPEDNLGRTLSVDVTTLNFTQRTNFTRPGSYPSEGSLPTDPDAKSMAQTYLRANGLLLNDYAQGEPLITHINVEPNGTFSLARSKSEAELIRVDFFRSAPFISITANVDGAEEIREALEKEYQDYPSTTENVIAEEGRVDLYNFNTQILPLDTQKGNITLYIGPDDNRKDDTEFEYIYGVDYTGWVIDPEPCGTYDLISATEVTTIIENGNGSLRYLNEVGGDYVVPYVPKRVSKFAVNEVILGYLDTPTEQIYMQPIYIVIGEATLDSGITGKFYYYIPAINYTVIRDRVIPEVTTVDSTTATPL